MTAPMAMKNSWTKWFTDCRDDPRLVVDHLDLNVGRQQPPGGSSSRDWTSLPKRRCCCRAAFRPREAGPGVAAVDPEQVGIRQPPIDLGHIADAHDAVVSEVRKDDLLPHLLDGGIAPMGVERDLNGPRLDGSRVGGGVLQLQRRSRCERLTP